MKLQTNISKNKDGQYFVIVRCPGYPHLTRRTSAHTLIDAREGAKYLKTVITRLFQAQKLECHVKPNPRFAA